MHLFSVVSVCLLLIKTANLGVSVLFLANQGRGSTHFLLSWYQLFLHLCRLEADLFITYLYCHSA